MLRSLLFLSLGLVLHVHAGPRRGDPPQDPGGRGETRQNCAAQLGHLEQPARLTREAEGRRRGGAARGGGEGEGGGARTRRGGEAAPLRGDGEDRGGEAPRRREDGGEEGGGDEARAAGGGGRGGGAGEGAVAFIAGLFEEAFGQIRGDQVGAVAAAAVALAVGAVVLTVGAVALAAPPPSRRRLAAGSARRIQHGPQAVRSPPPSPPRSPCSCSPPPRAEMSVFYIHTRSSSSHRSC